MLNAITLDECIRFALDSEDHPPNDIDVHVPVKVHSKRNLRGDKLIFLYVIYGMKIITIDSDLHTDAAAAVKFNSTSSKPKGNYLYWYNQKSTCY